ncbi:MAG: preprotein translocase subunit SecE [Planctomycetes bacterium]|nr:preprotein translocase subunit SecE [Planctomycetota bacterium]
MEKVINYFKTSWEEMKKVTWPTKKETYQYTIMVLVISLVVSIFLFALDSIFNWGLKSLIKF